jgi:uncharacterized protein with von Willebrand factor type A (vWA) domain
MIDLGALSSQEPARGGGLAQNIVHFARALRQAGLPIGPGAALDALAAVEAAGIGDRADFYTTLHAVFVKKHEHTLLFDQAFEIFWRRRGFIEQLIAAVSPQVRTPRQPSRPQAGASRIADALFAPAKEDTKPSPQIELEARLTTSGVELLRSKDFAQMSASEIATARDLIKRLVIPEDRRRTRRFTPGHRPFRIDARRSFRRSLQPDGWIDLEFRSPVERPRPVVALCDISGSMNEYTRLFLHFLHALGERRRVSTFLFGTRLTNVTRAMAARDPDDALMRCSGLAVDWSGGTRIGEALARFNRDWGRRVLGQGAIVLLFTDGLERDNVDRLEEEMERLSKSSWRVIWVNPLLRYEGFAAKALGVRAMLPHVHSFRPIHNLASMADLVATLSDPRDKTGDRKGQLLKVHE